MFRSRGPPAPTLPDVAVKSILCGLPPMPRRSPMLRQNTKARQDINALQVLTLRQLPPTPRQSSHVTQKSHVAAVAPMPRRISHVTQKSDVTAKSQRPAKFQRPDKVRHPRESSFVSNVPPERLRGGVSPYRYKGRRSWSPPLEMLSHFSPLAPFFFEIRGFRCLRTATKGRRPLETCKPLRKA